MVKGVEGTQPSEMCAPVGNVGKKMWSGGCGVGTGCAVYRGLTKA